VKTILLLVISNTLMTLAWYMVEPNPLHDREGAEE
jgi:uncharacterized protein (DUF486 family)